MSDGILGIHHVTAMAGAPHENVSFYTTVLGQRLVKRTVNFDDPGTWHLYYGDRLGRPGSIMTFFPWPLARAGRRGAGQATAASYRVPVGALDYWTRRLGEHGVMMRDVERRFDEEVLRLLDPHGLMLELVTGPVAADYETVAGAGVPAPQAARGFHGVTLTVPELGPTEQFLTDVMGFERLGEDRGRTRFRAGTGDRAALVDVVVETSEWGRISAGTIHHVAWRVESDAVQRRWQRRIADTGASVTPVLDRNYFRSIYFREPGGVLFEIATDSPGFTVDESAETLGTSLKLPEWLEETRERVEAALPPLERQG